MLMLMSIDCQQLDAEGLAEMHDCHLQSMPRL
jgi:hypothetical protein